MGGEELKEKHILAGAHKRCKRGFERLRVREVVGKKFGAFQRRSLGA